jgi:PAS domain S-box-containing protein
VTAGVRDELLQARRELQRLEAELSESEARQRSIVDTLSEGILVKDADGSVRLCNSRAASILGMSPEEIKAASPRTPLGQAIREDGSPFAPDEYPTAVTLASGWPQADVVMGMHRPDGTLVWISVNCQPLTRANEALPYAVVASFSDITERRRAQVALVESQSRLQLLNELARVVTTGMSEDQVVETTVTLVAAAFPALRVTYATMSARRLKIICSREPEGLGRVAGVEIEIANCGAYLDALARGGPVIIEDARANAMPTPPSPMLARTGLRAAVDVPIVHGEGIVGLLSFSTAMPRRWSTHEIATLLEVADALLGALHQARTLEARRRAEQAARESEGRFRRLTDASNDGIIISERGVIVEANERAAEMFGYGAQDLAGTATAQLAAPEMREMVARMNQQGIEGTFAAVGLRRDGSRFDLEVTGKTISLHGREARVTVLRDVTERKAVDRLKNEFVSTVSHELRTPLTSIRGSLGLLEGGVGGTMSAKGQELVRIARSNADRLIRLINDILDLEKMEAGKLELKITLVDAGELISATFDGIRAVAEQRGVRLESLPTCPHRMAGDRDRLIQVLTNLVSNALKFAPEGSTVSVRATAGNSGAVRIMVQDAGPGIPRELLDRLFKKFQQLDGSDTRARGGTGLGLAISRTIVEQHGGRIGVRSEPGQGSEFWFEIPAAPAGARTAAPPAEQPTVLVVEDDEEVGSLLGRLLREEGYRAVRTESIAAAEQLISHLRPAALLLDVELPDGNALDFLERLRAREPSRDLPAIVVSGRERDGTFAGPMLIDWLAKPFDGQRLLHALRHAMRRPGGPRVLLVDDDDGTRTVIAALLQSMQVECVEATDGADAMRIARELPPDLIVLDIGMPRTDGFELVDALRREQSRATPLVVYTGRDLSAGERRALTLGVTRHLTKARATEAEFVGTVRELLAGVLNGNGRARVSEGEA